MNKFGKYFLPSEIANDLSTKTRHNCSSYNKTQRDNLHKQPTHYLNAHKTMMIGVR